MVILSHTKNKERLMKMKKLISCTLALATICAMLSGCIKSIKGINAMPDTVKWFNATFAILLELNECDLGQYGGYIPNEQNKGIQERSLDEYWGVTDRKSADESIEWLINEGHRANYKDDVAGLKEFGLLDLTQAEFDKTLAIMVEQDALDEEDVPYFTFVKKLYDEKGENAINAWDYSRTFQLYAHYYIAGYYTREEAMDKSLEYAKKIQGEYSSWDEFVQSYFDGYMYWSEEFEATEGTQIAYRKAIYKTLTVKDNSPYSVDWNLELVKSW